MTELGREVHLVINVTNKKFINPDMMQILL